MAQFGENWSLIEEYDDMCVPINEDDDPIIGDGNVFLNGQNHVLADQSANFESFHLISLEINHSFENWAQNGQNNALEYEPVIEVVTSDENDDQNKPIDSSQVVPEFVTEPDNSPNVGECSQTPMDSTPTQTLSKTEPKKRGRPSKNWTQEEKKEAVKKTNKKSAKGYRNRNKQYTQQIEKDLENEEKQNLCLKLEVENLQKKIKLLKPYASERNGFDIEYINQNLEQFKDSQNN